MNRKEFLEKGLTLGLGLPFLSLFAGGCEKEEGTFPDLQPNFDGKVIVVGAGAAGLAAGYLLQRYGVDFQVIEASADFGGRVKRDNSLADFPIDLGGEWIHAEPSILSDIIDDPQVEANVDLVTYNPQTIQAWNNGRLRNLNFGSNFYSEYKFKNTTWYGFFEQFIVPSFQDKIILNEPISEIDYSGEKVVLTSLHGNSYEADRVLITVPIKILQSDVINFVPNLPTAKQDAIDGIFVGDGFKAFIEFEERFYPDMLVFGNLFQALSTDEKAIYDAAFRKDSGRHILGLFSINDEAAAYANLDSEQEILDKILAELDEMFNGQASEHYVQHVFQNWSTEPYIRGAYSYDYANGQDADTATIVEPLDGKLFFAGEAVAGYNSATVHGACESAYQELAKVLQV